MLSEDKLKKIRHDISSDIEAVKMVLQILRPELKDEEQIYMTEKAIEKMNNLKINFAELKKLKYTDE